MLSALLQLSGIISRSAGSASEAQRMISSQRFDLYVLDAWLPGLDGFELCRQIRAVDSTTPIVFYSGAAYDSDKEMGIAAGANAYIAKPDVEGLAEALSRLIARAIKPAIEPRFTAIDRSREANKRSGVYDVATVPAESWS